MKKLFTIVAFCGAIMCMQPDHAAASSWWDMGPQKVPDKINQRIMSIEDPTRTIFSVIDHCISRDNRNTPIRIYKPAEKNKIAGFGDDAGENMTTALYLMNRDRSGPNLNQQVLIHPAPDLTCKGTIQRQNNSLDRLRWQTIQCLSDPNDAKTPYASSLMASKLRNEPPAVMILAEQDDLRDAGQEYADRLQAAGISTYVYYQQGAHRLEEQSTKTSSYPRESLDIAMAQIQKPFSVSKANKSTNEQLPELVFRPQTAQEAFSFVEHLVNRLPWFKENGYNIVLPTHPDLEVLYQNSQKLSDSEKNDLRDVFITQIYNEKAFDSSLAKLEESQQSVNKGLEKLSELPKNWNFDFKEKYQIVLTLYGPGGSYNPPSGTVVLLTTEKGEFVRKCIAEIILHEIVHIGIEESIVEQYKLTHWEKERLVDLICHHYLNEILPEYRMQQKGDKRVDDFVNEYTIIHDLPSAIENLIKQYRDNK